MQVSPFKVIYSGLLLAGVAYGVMELRGPNGISALMAKRQQIRQIEKENESLHREVESTRQQVEELKNNPEKQDLEIRKGLGLMKPGEKTYIMQDAPSSK